MHMARIPTFDTALLWPDPVHEVLLAHATVEHIIATLYVIALQQQLCPLV